MHANQAVDSTDANENKGSLSFRLIQFLKNPATPIWIAMAWSLCVWFHALSQEWRLNPQYQYGWAVAPISLYWLLTRKPTHSVAKGHLKQGKGRTTALYAFLILLTCLWIPSLILNRSHPEWRFTLWFLSAEVISIWLVAAFVLGGKSEFRRFLFPMMFLWIAVPWPSQLETPIIQALTRWSAVIVAEALNWMGSPAAARGALIELASGVVGIEEACTGIRSLQSGIMISIFFIYEYRLTFRRGLALFLCSCALALTFNLIRTFILTLGVSESGAGFYTKYHGVLGAAVFGALFFLLLILAKQLIRRDTPADETDLENISETDSSQRAFNAASDPLPSRTSVLLRWALPLVLVFSEVFVFFWFHRPGLNWQSAPKWTAQWPGASDPNFREVVLSDPIKLSLRYDSSVNFQWRESESSIWTFYYFRWKPGSVASRFARNHNPKLCLPANGFEWQRDLGLIEVETDIMPFWFIGYVYKLKGRYWRVYYGIWEDRVPAEALNEYPDDPERAFMNATPEEMSRKDRFTSAWHGKRNQGQRLIEIAIDGAESDEAAVDSLRQNLREFIVPLSQ